MAIGYKNSANDSRQAKSEEQKNEEFILKVKALAKSREDIKNENAVLKDKVAAAEASVEQMKQELARASETNAALEKRIAELDTTYGEMNKSAVNFEQYKATLEAKCARYEIQLAEKENEAVVSSAKEIEEKNTLQKRCEELEAKLEMSEQEQTKAKSELEKIAKINLAQETALSDYQIQLASQKRNQEFFSNLSADLNNSGRWMSQMADKIDSMRDTEVVHIPSAVTPQETVPVYPRIASVEIPQSEETNSPMQHYATTAKDKFDDMCRDLNDVVTVMNKKLEAMETLIRP